MSDLSAFHALLRAAHEAAEAQRVEAAKLCEELAAVNVKTMEETIKRLEAEKVLKSLAISVYICRSRQVNDLPGFFFLLLLCLVGVSDP